MSQGDSLAAAAGATMALMLVSRALLGAQLSVKARAWMALAWVLLIVAGAVIAAWLGR
jgi:hypothetical protein